MNDISKHLGDERRLKLDINRIKEIISKSTPVVNWYAHTEDKTIRGPFGRWFTATGENEHLAQVSNDVEYCGMAMTILPDMVIEIESFQAKLKVATEAIKKISCDYYLVQTATGTTFMHSEYCFKCEALKEINKQKDEVK